MLLEGLVNLPLLWRLLDRYQGAESSRVADLLGVKQFGPGYMNVRAGGPGVLSRVSLQANAPRSLLSKTMFDHPAVDTAHHRGYRKVVSYSAIGIDMGMVWQVACEIMLSFDNPEIAHWLQMDMQLMGLLQTDLNGVMASFGKQITIYQGADLPVERLQQVRAPSWSGLYWTSTSGSAWWTRCVPLPGWRHREWSISVKRMVSP